jgi:hypothetical protein
VASVRAGPSNGQEAYGGVTTRQESVNLSVWLEREERETNTAGYPTKPGAQGADGGVDCTALTGQPLQPCQCG